ncbi:(d)CMP kinase [Moraxella sp. ZY210820]|uniref:(d)CMP kinase n=1 Tax=unclassified Moraxella TaxID=2685852 RepID=UPI00272F1C47|nr:(d)CMP kinase [Moraxella sp. ZY210820]WLF82878.1 (d)CMP kinase [Moraxella sp. ZY210820]
MTMIITIDGPSGSGKGTLAAKLAQHYGYDLLDSGAIYRLLGLALSQANLLDKLESQLVQAVEIAEHLDIKFKNTADGVLTYLNGKDVSHLIRNEQVGAYASKVAVIPELRTALLTRQQNFAQGQGIVADGRDMGTVVFPNAQAKIYLTASAEARAERRFKQLQNAGQNANIEQILAQIQERDKRDMERITAPLKPAADALLIDSSDLSVDEVFQQMIDYIQSRQ